MRYRGDALQQHSKLETGGPGFMPQHIPSCVAQTTTPRVEVGRRCRLRIQYLKTLIHHFQSGRESCVLVCNL
jgi:hypothetical protein